MIYFDMDGVLVKYEYAMYSPESKWDVAGSHIFRNLQPMEDSCEVLRRLIQLFRDEVHILTSVSDKTPEVRNEHIKDKMLWIEENIPSFNLCNFMACSGDKPNVITKIRGMRLNRMDILIDDYNPNLYAWQAAGGTAIKFINGINSVGIWRGPYIDGVAWATSEMVEAILKTWQDVVQRG